MKDFAKKRQFLDERVEPSVYGGKTPRTVKAAAAATAYQTGRSNKSRNATVPRRRIKLGPWLVLLVILLLCGSVAEKAVKTYREQHPATWQEFFKMVAHKPASRKNNTDTAQPAVDQPSGPTFDFYTVLPNQNAALPTLQSKPQNTPDGATTVTAGPAVNSDQSQQAGSALSANTPAPAIAPQYLLVVGAYKTRQQAMDMHSRLTLMNISSHVTEASVHDKLVYRVELGPYDNKDVASSVRSQIQQQGVFGASIMTVSGNSP